VTCSTVQKIKDNQSVSKEGNINDVNCVQVFSNKLLGELKLGKKKCYFILGPNSLYYSESKEILNNTLV
jgi:hypothetical protein